MLGVEVNSFGTYASEIRADGSIFGGGEWTVQERGRRWFGLAGVRPGEVWGRRSLSYRGILYYRTASQKLAK